MGADEQAGRGGIQREYEPNNRRICCFPSSGSWLRPFAAASGLLQILAEVVDSKTRKVLGASFVQINLEPADLAGLL